MTPGHKIAPSRDLSICKRKILKNRHLRNYWTNVYQTSQECTLGGPLSGPFKLLPPGTKRPVPGFISFSSVKSFYIIFSETTDPIYTGFHRNLPCVVFSFPRTIFKNLLRFYLTNVYQNS